MCFTNTLEAAKMMGETAAQWRYCEGFAYQARFDVAFPHAWLIDAECNVMETTWKHRDAIYVGVAFDLRDVVAAMDVEPGGIIHDDWLRDLQFAHSHESCCGEPIRSPG